MVNVISDRGLKPDPKKVDVIVKMPVPKDKVQLASFLRMCQYLSITFQGSLMSTSTAVRTE